MEWNRGSRMYKTNRVYAKANKWSHKSEEEGAQGGNGTCTND